MSLWRAEHRRGLGRRAHALPANHRLGCSAAMTPSPHGRLRRLPRHDFKHVASLSRPEISVNKLAAISSLTSFNAPAASSRRLGGKQEVALARKVPLEVPQAKADPKQVDAIDATLFLRAVTSGALRGEKPRRDWPPRRGFLGRVIRASW